MKLKVPKDIRPTSSKVKEAIFSVLRGYLSRYENLNCLDLFAGSGALGLKALEEGIDLCVFFDKSSCSIQAIKENIQKYKFEAKSKVLKKDVLKFEFTENFDLIFADPPYSLNKDEVEIIFEKVRRVLNPRGIFVFEFSSRFDFLQINVGFELLQKKIYGDTTVCFFSLPE
ncbi:MAG: RsmD family RNA methyltransferase [Candidatus Caenarcaniphilales bacterium]|nr:RsmD family RNA methyltransferase [Candidatus Caenarcaniphilales bacterium]